MGLPTHRKPVLSTIGCAPVRRQDGQILPGLVVLMIAILALGILAFGVGRAAILRSDAQTAADAAALAGAKNVRAQLEAQVAATGSADLSRIDRSAVQAAAESYAARNGAELSRPISIESVDVRAWVRTKADAGDDGRTEGEARGRAGVVAQDVSPGIAGGDLGLDAGPLPDCDKDDLKIDDEGGAKGIVDDAVSVARCTGGNSVYVCSALRPSSTTTSGNVSDHSSNSAGQAARDISVREINCLSGPSSIKLSRAVVAIGKNFGRNYGSGRQRIVDTFGWKGYRVQIIWFTPEYGDHRGHIHIGVRKGGAPVGGGTGGPLVHAELEVKLIDWDAPTSTDVASLFASQASGNPFGPPDPAVAAKLCRALEETNAPPRARLALWMAAIVESGVHDLSYGHSSSVGVLQLLDIHLGGSVAARRDVVRVAKLFLQTGFTGKGGAIAIARRNPGLSPGLVAQAVQGSANPERYDQRRQQAEALDRRFCK